MGIKTNDTYWCPFPDCQTHRRVEDGKCFYCEEEITVDGKGKYQRGDTRINRKYIQRSRKD